MLASALPDDVSDLRALNIKFPVLVSPKLDGIRASIQGGRVISRSQKELPNLYVQKLYGSRVLEGLDGELIVGDPVAEDVFNTTQSAVMREEGSPYIAYYVFDQYNSDGFVDRLCDAKNRIHQQGYTPSNHITLVEHEFAKNVDDLLAIEKKYLDAGYEGLMLRAVHGRYKEGRSTLKEGILLKLKRFVDAEAEVIGFEEQMENTNEKTLEARGKAKRSSHKAGKVPKNTLGKFLVRDLKTGIEFAVGTGEGLTNELRQTIWNNRAAYLGQIIVYKYQPKGIKTKPRIPIWKGFRSALDMDAAHA